MPTTLKKLKRAECLCQNYQLADENLKVTFSLHEFGIGTSITCGDPIWLAII